MLETENLKFLFKIAKKSHIKILKLQQNLMNQMTQNFEFLFSEKRICDDLVFSGNFNKRKATKTKNDKIKTIFRK